MPAIQQQESILIVGTITGNGNATVTVTKAGMTGSPLAISVPVVSPDSAATVAGKMVAAMNAVGNFSAVCLAYNVSATLYVMVLTAAANDSTMNVAYTNGSCTGLTPNAASQHAVLGDAGGITNGYCTLADFKALYSVTGADATRDAAIEDVIEDVSRAIDDATHRKFYGASPATARYFTAPTPERVYIDDCTSITAVAIDVDQSLGYNVTLTTSDYWTEPVNESFIEWLESKPFATWRLPCHQYAIRITAVWGYCLTGYHPGPIRRACLLQSNRIYERRKAAFGMTSGSDMAPQTVIKLDNDVIEMVQPYVKNWFG